MKHTALSLSLIALLSGNTAFAVDALCYDYPYNRIIGGYVIPESGDSSSGYEGVKVSSWGEYTDNDSVYWQLRTFTGSSYNRFQTPQYDPIMNPNNRGKVHIRVDWVVDWVTPADPYSGHSLGPLADICEGVSLEG